MRRLVLVGGLAALLACGGALLQPALAQQPDEDLSTLDLMALQEELGARIEEADRLIQQIDSGGMLLPTGMGLQVVPRDGVVQWATERLYREGAGIGGTIGQEEVLRRVREWASVGARLNQALRRNRERDVRLQQLTRRRIERRGMDAAAAPAPTLAVACGFPRRWQVRMANGSVSLDVDASGNVSGSGIVQGSATLTRNQLTLRFSSQSQQGLIAGRYVVALDGACNGAGELVFDSLPDGAGALGIRGGPVTITSLGR